MFLQFIDKAFQNRTVSSGITQDYVRLTVKTISHFLSEEMDWNGHKTERQFCSVYQKCWQFLEAKQYLHIKRTHFTHGNTAWLKNNNNNKTQKMQMQKKNIQKYICIMEVCRPKEVFAEVHEVNLT